MSSVPADVSVVLATHNRRDEACAALERLLDLPDRVEIIAVDDASTDGTARALRRLVPRIVTIEVDRNLGAAARNVGVRRASAPFVAFCDDDSSWRPHALSTAAAVLGAHPRLGLVAARILLGEQEQLEPASAAMERSPLPPRARMPGRPILGFVACGAVVRREAFLQAGGFHPRFHLGGEERLLAIDLARDGWALSYMDDVVAAHHPSARRDPPGRRRIVTRNDLWTAWLRRRPSGVAAETARTLRDGVHDPPTRAGIAEALAGAAWVWRERRPVPRWLEHQLRILESTEDAGGSVGSGGAMTVFARTLRG